MVWGNQEPRIEDRWHRDPKRGENPLYAADTPEIAGTWCQDKSHGQPCTRVCTAKHGTGKRWMVRWKFNGKETSESFDNKAMAERHRAKVTAELFTGHYVDRSRSEIAFGIVAEEWHNNVKAPKLKPSSLAGQRSILDNRVLHRWKDVPLSAVTHADIQGWLTWMVTAAEARQLKTTNEKRAGERKPLSASSAIKAYQVLSQVLQYAVRTRRLAANPADGVELPRVVTRPETALSHEQVAALVAAAGDTGPIILTLAYTALRFGELAALRVGDVDVPNRLITVSKAVSQVTGKGLVEDTTKTHQARVVPILTVEVAETLKRQIDGRMKSEYLFPAPDGGAMRNSYVKWRFDRACKEAGISGVTIKTLRHTGGSLALDVEGTTIVTVSKLLGHRNVTTTSNVYMHKLPNAFDNLAQGMDAAVKAIAPRTE
jgi:integrase